MVLEEESIYESQEALESILSLLLVKTLSHVLLGHNRH